MDISVQGNKVRCYTGGQPVREQRATLVFLHGAANDHSVWQLQSRWFAHHGYNVLAPDLPGHGNSQGAPLSSIEEIADWTHELIASAQVVKACLVGHSMGSLAALAAAARFPERFDKIVLVGCAVPMTVSDALLEAAREKPQDAIEMITTWSHAPNNLLSGGPLPGVWLPGVNKALMNRAAPGVLFRDLLNCRNYLGGLDDAKRVGCRSLLIAGDRDLMTPSKAARALVGALPSVREVRISGAGHAMMSEAPVAVRSAIQSFLDDE
jgi:pimeloyl-ACP methyl ester carboxylesterase